MIRTQIQLTDQQAERIKRIASARHVSMAEVIRNSVDSFTRTLELDDRAVRKQRGHAVVGRFSSGTRDLARNHDKHFAEAYK